MYFVQFYYEQEGREDDTDTETVCAKVTLVL